MSGDAEILAVALVLVTAIFVYAMLTGSAFPPDARQFNRQLRKLRRARKRAERRRVNLVASGTLVSARVQGEAVELLDKEIHALNTTETCAVCGGPHKTWDNPTREGTR